MLASKLRFVATQRVGATVAANAVKRGLLPTASCVGTQSVNGFSRTAATPSSTSTSYSSRRFISTQDEKTFQDMGLLDEYGLAVFDTLHEMQYNACQVYAKNELFGTYDTSAEAFQFMTYAEYNDKVNQCRSLLKDLGTGFFVWGIVTDDFDSCSMCFFVILITHIFSLMLAFFHSP